MKLNNKIFDFVSISSIHSRKSVLSIKMKDNLNFAVVMNTVITES